jgi:Icc-related predicted phosphoesterase
LGNHDHHSGVPDLLTEVLRAAGVTVLEASSTIVEVAGVRVGIAGAKGCGGGFANMSVHSHGEAEMKAVAAYVEATASGLKTALDQIGRDADVVVAMTHYACVRDTLDGEPRELYPLLGSHLLAAAIDGDPIDGYLGSRHRPDLVPGSGTQRGERKPVTLAVHGHAHYGSECGTTPGGTPVRNVAAALIGDAYAVYRLPDVTRLP